MFTIQIDPEGDIVTGGGKDGRIVATNPDGEILDETSLPEYVGGARCVVLSQDGVVYVGTTRYEDRLSEQLKTLFSRSEIAL